MQQQVAPVQGQLTEANELANQLQEMGVVLSHVIVTRLESVQKRCKTLQTHANDRLLQLQQAIHDFGPDSQSLLTGNFAMTFIIIPY